MKNLFCLFFVIFSLFILVSCGGNENSGNDSREESYTVEDGNISLSLRLAGRDGTDNTGSGSNNCMNINCIEKLAAIAFKITDGKGNVVFQKSVKREELKDLKELTEIKDAENATLTVSIFEADDTLQANMNTVTWAGKVTGLRFKEGETTTVDLLLYPQSQNSQKIMPDGLNVPRFGHTSTLLADGRILVAGGFTACGSNGKCQATDSVEIIDLESGTIEALANMTERRAMHKAIALGDGSVVFIGGVQGFSTVQQEAAFEGFPLLPYDQVNAVSFIERYMPSYPKHNMKLNNLGSEIENRTQKIDSQIPFSIFQSILTRKISDNQFDVYLVGGIDSENKPSNKSYKFSLTLDNGQLSASTPTELAESSEPMLLPALAYSDGSILAVGGRPADSEYAASLISESSSEDKGQNSGYNLFFASSISAKNNLYTFGGFNTEDGAITESGYNKVLEWSVSSDVKAGDKNMLTRGQTIAFSDISHDEANDRFIVVGGTNAADIYQVINATSLEVFGTTPSHTMFDNRIMPATVIIPAGILSPNPVAIITGGISALSGTGIAVKDIEINIM
jgi:hypothetical protein